MIHLYRHAHAGTRKNWNGPDRDRPLDERGVLQALSNADRLAGTNVTRILTSPYLRCIQSVEPLSEATGVPVELEPRLAEHSDPDSAIALLTEIEPGTVLCSHGDIVSAIVGRIAAEGAAMSGDMVWQKGSIWHLEPGPGRRIGTANYEPPPITSA